MKRILFFGAMLLILSSFTTSTAQESSGAKPFARVVFEIDLPQGSSNTAGKMIILIAILDPYVLDSPGDYTKCHKKVGEYEYTVKITKRNSEETYFQVVQGREDGYLSFWNGTLNLMDTNGSIYITTDKPLPLKADVQAYDMKEDFQKFENTVKSTRTMKQYDIQDFECQTQKFPREVQ